MVVGVASDGGGGVGTGMEVAVGVAKSLVPVKVVFYPWEGNRGSISLVKLIIGGI